LNYGQKLATGLSGKISQEITAGSPWKLQTKKLKPLQNSFSWRHKIPQFSPISLTYIEELLTPLGSTITTSDPDNTAESSSKTTHKKP